MTTCVEHNEHMDFFMFGVFCFFWCLNRVYCMHMFAYVIWKEENCSSSFYIRSSLKIDIILVILPCRSESWQLAHLVVFFVFFHNPSNCMPMSTLYMKTITAWSKYTLFSLHWQIEASSGDLPAQDLADLCNFLPWLMTWIIKKKIGNLSQLI